MLGSLSLCLPRISSLSSSSYSTLTATRNTDQHRSLTRLTPYDSAFLPSPSIHKPELNQPFPHTQGHITVKEEKTYAFICSPLYWLSFIIFPRISFKLKLKAIQSLCPESDIRQLVIIIFFLPHTVQLCAVYSIEVIPKVVSMSCK